MEYDIIVYDKVQVISKYKILNKNYRKSIINKVPGHFIYIQIKWARTDQRQALHPRRQRCLSYTICTSVYLIRSGEFINVVTRLQASRPRFEPRQQQGHIISQGTDTVPAGTYHFARYIHRP
jgi:hypothetical protein